jgi:murein DD-endopeptidase MepM/ murein hydrolase activator NlpD
MAGYTYPTTGRNVSQGYSSSHPALDITGGGDISSFADGKVVYVQTDGQSGLSDSMKTLGTCVVINHDNPDTSKKSGSYARTIYAHLASKTVNAGATVTKGSKIGVMGTTGNSSGIHLHFVLAVGNDASLAPNSTTGWVSQSLLPTLDPKVYLSEYK